MKVIVVFIFLIAGISGGRAQSERTLIRKGNKEYKDNKYTDAEVNYRKALEKNKELHEGTFNLGDALYKQGRFDEAAEQYRLSSTRTNDGKAKAQAYHNLGNALLKGQKFPESITAYKDALKLSPNDSDTKYNLEYAKALLKQQQQKQQQQNKDQKKENKQDKNQQKQDQSKQDQSKQEQQKQNQDQQKQGQEQQQQAQQKEQPQKKDQQKKQQISKEDADRILEALKNEEKNVQKKLQKKVPARIKVEKDW